MRHSKVKSLLADLNRPVVVALFVFSVVVMTACGGNQSISNEDAQDTAKAAAEAAAEADDALDGAEAVAATVLALFIAVDGPVDTSDPFVAREAAARIAEISGHVASAAWEAAVLAEETAEGSSSAKNAAADAKVAAEKADDFAVQAEEVADEEDATKAYDKAVDFALQGAEQALLVMESAAVAFAQSATYGDYAEEAVSYAVSSSEAERFTLVLFNRLSREAGSPSVEIDDLDIAAESQSAIEGALDTVKVIAENIATFAKTAWEAARDATEADSAQEAREARTIARDTRTAALDASRVAREAVTDAFDIAIGYIEAVAKKEAEAAAEAARQEAAEARISEAWRLTETARQMVERKSRGYLQYTSAEWIEAEQAADHTYRDYVKQWSSDVVAYQMAADNAFADAYSDAVRATSKIVYVLIDAMQKTVPESSDAPATGGDLQKADINLRVAELFLAKVQDIAEFYFSAETAALEAYEDVVSLAEEAVAEANIEIQKEAAEFTVSLAALHVERIVANAAESAAAIVSAQASRDAAANAKRAAEVIAAQVALDNALASARDAWTTSEIKRAEVELRADEFLQYGYATWRIAESNRNIDYDFPVKEWFDAVVAYSNALDAAAQRDPSYGDKAKAAFELTIAAEATFLVAQALDEAVYWAHDAEVKYYNNEDEKNTSRQWLAILRANVDKAAGAATRSQEHAPGYGAAELAQWAADFAARHIGYAAWLDDRINEIP